MDALLSRASEEKDLFGHISESDNEEAAQAVPLTDKEEPGVESGAQPGVEVVDGVGIAPTEPLEPSRALTIGDFVPPSSGARARLIRLAYRMGVPGATIAAPFRKPGKIRLLATVEAPALGDRTTGIALRAGHFLAHEVKAPIGQVEFGSSSTGLTPPFERVVHGFDWLADLACSAPREQCVSTAERIAAAWLNANPAPAKGPAWEIEHVGHRLLAWLVHAPLVLSDQKAGLRARMLEAIDTTARWLDRNVTNAADRLGEVAGWSAITAAGLLLPLGKPRRLYGEAGLLKALGELVAEDGGVLSRSPMAQMDAIAMLTNLLACYRAVDRDPPQALGVMLELLVPPLLALRHGDGGLGSWQGANAVRADRVAALVDASGVRTRPLKDVRHWGYQRLTGGKATVQFDAAPPPKARHARWGSASTLAFEMSDGDHRLIVNCGGSALAGGLVPARIEQGLRASAAHSALVLDNANSTAVLINGKLGKGVEQVEVDRRTLGAGGQEATRVEASHDGYAARYGLTHRRILMLRADGTELRGEDILQPQAKRGQRGKIAYALRFHLGVAVETRLADDRGGASLVLPNGSLWQFRIAGDETGARVSLEESLWVDGTGRPRPTQQLVIEGMTQRGGGQFSWLLKKMG
ncbi:MAG: heparinase II/III family protein [Erythrobacter sp.]